jgi:Lon-like protease
MKDENNEKLPVSSETSINQETGNRSNKKKFFSSFFTLLLLAGLILYLLFGIKLPYMFQAPGAADRVSGFVRINDIDVPESDGSFYLTTVIYERANIFLYLWGIMDKNAEIIPVDDFDAFTDQEQRNKLMREQMETSKLKAMVAAFREMGYKIDVKKSPVEIVAVARESEARRVLKEGDVIFSLDGTYIRGEEQVIEISDNFTDEESVNMVVIRDGKKKEVSVPLTLIGEKKRIGIIITSHITDVNLPMDVEIESGNIIGSSAGLMFTLEIIRQVSGMELTEKDQIAGTGVIDEDGTVYPISGAGLKVIAAEQEKINYFLVPEKNYYEAAAQAKNIKLYAVKDLKDAIAALREINPSLSPDPENSEDSE